MTEPDQPPLRAWLDRLTSEPDVVAHGWATVDLDRAVGEAGLAEARWTDVTEALLGARGKRATVGWSEVVILEPSTEGRLAAFLARHGEGPSVTYRRRAAAAPGGGPTLAAGPRFGPFVIEVDG